MRIVRGVQFDAGDRELVERALGPYRSALGVDDKGREVVGRHVHRIVGNHGPHSQDGDEGYAGEPYFADDVASLMDATVSLIELFEPQTDPAWWSSRGADDLAPSSEGLALQRSIAVNHLEILRAKCVEWLAAAHGVLA